METASLLKFGSDLELHHAVVIERLEDVKFLVEKKHCNPMQRDQHGFAPIHIAAVVGSVQILDYFVNSDCNPTCTGPHGSTPLHLASELGHFDVVRYLITKQQIDPLCEENDSGITPLHLACVGGHQAVVEFLSYELTKYTPITELVSDKHNSRIPGPFNSTILHLRLEL